MALAMLKDRIRQVHLLNIDLNGVLTNRGLCLDQESQPHKRFDVHDGFGLMHLEREGIQMAFQSGGNGGATEVKA